MRFEADSEGADPARAQEFMGLYAGCQRRLYLYVTALLPGSADAEDVLQEATLVLWRKFSQFEPESNFFAWACSVTRFEVLKYRERQARRTPQLDQEVFEMLASELPQEEGFDSLRRRSLRECLGQISAADRDLILLRYSAEHTVQGIAAEQGRSPNALSKSLGRIRRLLLQCIENKLARELE